MKVLLTGGTGFVGASLIPALIARGHAVTVLTRAPGRKKKLPQGAEFLVGDPTQKGQWQERVSDHDVIINLAGASIFTRWTKEHKRLIRESRILTTRHLVEALSDRKGRETLLLSTSAVGYYGFCGDEERMETSPQGRDFLASVTGQWEAEAFKARSWDVRVVTCRFGIVLGAGGGALARILPPFKWCLGAPLGSGRQWFSWIHEQDISDIYLFLMDQKGISGPVNCTAPNPVTNKELTKAVANVLHRPAVLPPVPGVMIRLLMGEFGSVLLEGQKVFPEKLLDAGFQFKFQNITQALEDILKR